MKMLTTIAMTISKTHVTTNDAFYVPYKVMTVEDCPEKNGYNIRDCKEQGLRRRPFTCLLGLLYFQSQFACHDILMWGRSSIK